MFKSNLTVKEFKDLQNSFKSVEEIRVVKKPCKVIKYTESQHQIAVFKWLNNPLVIRKYPFAEGLIWSNNNTQETSGAKAARHKAMGSKAGIPDIQVALPISCLEKGTDGLYIPMKYHGLFIEMKRPDLKSKTTRGKGGVTEEQQKMINRLQAVGYMVKICYSATEAIDVIENYLKEVI